MGQGVCFAEETKIPTGNPEQTVTRRTGLYCPWWMCLIDRLCHRIRTDVGIGFLGRRNNVSRTSNEDEKKVRQLYTCTC